MPQKAFLRHHLSPDWRRQVENVGQAAARLWATPPHTPG